MVITGNQERVSLLLREAIPMLCKNGLSSTKAFSIEALVGITLDTEEVFLVSIKETIQNDCINMDGKVSSYESDDTIDVYLSDQSDNYSSQQASTRRSKKCVRPKKQKQFGSNESNEPENQEVETQISVTEDIFDNTLNEGSELQSGYSVIKNEPQNDNKSQAQADISRKEDITSVTDTNTQDDRTTSDLKQYMCTESDTHVDEKTTNNIRLNENDILIDSPVKNTSSDKKIATKSEFKCSMENCKFVTTTNVKLRTHKKRKHLPRKFECNMCSRKFAMKYDLSAHIKISHGTGFKCDICNKSWQSKCGLQDHKIKKHGFPGKYICSYQDCKKSFYRKDEFYDHLNAHGDIKSHVCSNCGKDFSNRRNKQKHEKRCLSDFTFVCSACRKSYRTKADLEQHKRSHNDSGYSCKKCGKVFKYLTSYYSHNERCRQDILLDKT